MKKILSIVLLFSVMGCTHEKLDVAKAKTVVEKLIAAADKKDYQNISKYYTDGLNEGEPEAARIEKLLALKQLLGDIKQVTLAGTADTLYNDQTALYLTYKIKHVKVTSTQMFMVIKEKGDYKIAQQNVESVNGT